MRRMPVPSSTRSPVTSLSPEEFRARLDSLCLRNSRELEQTLHFHLCAGPPQTEF